MVTSVAIRAVSKVVPKNHVQFADPFALSSIDHRFCSALHYPQLIFYFKSHYTSSTEIASLMQRLKESLAMVLDYYPVVAGRVRSTKEGRLTLVREPGDGVVFLEATTDAQLDDWPDLRWCSLPLELNPQDTMAREIEEVPMAKVQVTVFKCGGLALGFSFAHILTDGTGAIQFLKAWGEIHQGKPLSIAPKLSRTIMKARDPPQLSDEDISSFVVPASSKQQASIVCGPTDDTLSSTLPEFLFMRVSDKKVSECVKEVERGPFAYGSATSHEALCALLWSSLTRARGWSSDREESTFYFPINIRSRCDPPIPEGYFGNAILKCCAVAKAVSIATHHISYAAKIIHESINRYDAAFCQSTIDRAELELPNAKSPCLQFGEPESFGCNTFAGLPIYKLNFGWGKPLYVSFIQIRPKSDPGPRSGVLIMPSPDDGRSRDVTIGCSDEKEMDALLKDPLFLPYRD